MSKVKITLYKSLSGRPATQRRTVEALGLSKTNQTIEKELTPQISGMIKAVGHLVRVEK